MRLLSFLCLLILLVGCSREEMLQRFATPEDQAAARHHIDLLRARDYNAIEKDMDPSLVSFGLRDTLIRMAAMIPAGDPASVELVGAQRSVNLSSGHGLTTVNSTFEYRFGDQWRLISVAIKKENGVSTIVGFHIYPESQSVKTANRFALANKSLYHYLVLAAAILAVLITLIALVTCIRTRLVRRKWLWILFILIGVGNIGINWTSGQLVYQPLSIQMFSASAFAQGYAPWIVSFSLPLGAILFLVLRKKLSQAERASHRH